MIWKNYPSVNFVVTFILQTAFNASKSVYSKHFLSIVPSASPVFHSYRNISSTSIQLQWHKVLSNHQNGVILGYRIYYRPRLRNNSWNVTDVVGESRTRLTIKNLTMFIGYYVRISAFTSKGEGNISESILVSTDEDGKESLIYLGIIYSGENDACGVTLIMDDDDGSNMCSNYPVWI